MELNPGVPKSPFPLSPHRTSLAVSSAGLRLKLPFYIYSVQSSIRLAQLVFPAIVHSIWGPYGHDQRAFRATCLWREHRGEQGSRTKTRGTTERIPVSVGYVFPHFDGQALALSPLSNYLCFQGWTERQVPSCLILTSQIMGASLLCWTLFPSDLQGINWWFPGACKVRLPLMPALSFAFSLLLLTR